MVILNQDKAGEQFGGTFCPLFSGAFTTGKREANFSFSPSDHFLCDGTTLLKEALVLSCLWKQVTGILDELLLEHILAVMLNQRNSTYVELFSQINVIT